jgi:hypothetical protein
MTIEDINYLKKNCKKENFILFVDSAKRNKSIGTTPSEYTVIFDEPFKNVYGLDILDAAIPRTMYTIDKYNNTFSFTSRYNNINYIKDVELDNQDYNIETLLEELAIVLSFDIGTESIKIDSFSLSTPYIRKSKIFYESKYPFKFDFNNDNNIGEILGFDEYAVKDYSDLYTQISDREFGSLRIKDTGEEIFQYTKNDLETYFVSGITTDGVKTYFDTDNSSNFVNIYKRHSAMQTFNQIEDTYNYSSYNRSINSVIIYIGLKHTTDPADYLYPSTLSSLNIKWEIREYNIETNKFYSILQSGVISDNPDLNLENITITELDNTVNLHTNPIYKVEIKLDSDDFNLIQYSGNNGYNILSFILHEDSMEDDNKDGLIWYYNTIDSKYTENIAVDQIEAMRLFTWNDSNLLENCDYTEFISEYDTGFGLIIDDLRLNKIINHFITGNSFGLTIKCTYKKFSLTPSGRITLVGERFIVLRCPEIESQLGSSYAYGSNSPGLALFKLGVLGYADARFDFSSISYKEFHPIGKLDKLHFRFETANGKLYDFKGVNHNLLIVIKYLRPNIENNNNIKYYPLNQNYNPSFIDYLRKQDDILNDEDTDEEDADFLEKNFNKIYMEKEKKYIESSDEDLTDNKFKDVNGARQQNNNYDSEDSNTSEKYIYKLPQKTFKW